MHVFGIGYGCVEVKIGQVNPKKDRAWHADGEVNEKFGCGQVRSGRGFVARIVDAITANCEACAILFFFLWVKIAANATIRGPFVQQDLCLSNEEAGVSSLYVPDALKKPPNLVCGACLSQGAGALVLDQVAVFEHVSRFVIDDSSDEMVGNMVLNGKLVGREHIAYCGWQVGRGVDRQWHEFGRDDAVDHVSSPGSQLALRGWTGM